MFDVKLSCELAHLSGPRHRKQSRKIQWPRPRQLYNIPLHIRPMRCIQIVRRHPIPTQHIHSRPPFILTQSQTCRDAIHVRRNLTKDQMLSRRRSQWFCGTKHLLSDAQQPGDTVVGDAGGGAERQQATGGLGGVLVDGTWGLFV